MKMSVQKIISMILAMIMTLSVFAGINVTGFADEADEPETDFTIPDSAYINLDLPFAWESVDAYLTDGNLALFLIIERADGQSIGSVEETVSNDCVYTLYYTADFVSFNQLDVDISSVSEEYCSYYLFEDFSIDYIAETDIYYCSSTYSPEISCYETISFVFDGEAISYLPFNAAGANLYHVGDKYITADESIFPVVKFCDQIDQDLYKITVVPSFTVFSADFTEYHEENGPEITVNYDTEQTVGEQINMPVYSQSVGTDDCIAFRCKPGWDVEWIEYSEYSNVYLSTNGTDYIELDSLSSAYYPYLFLNVKDRIIGLIGIFNDRNEVSGVRILSYSKTGSYKIVANYDNPFDYYAYTRAYNDYSFAFLLNQTDLSANFVQSDIFEFCSAGNLTDIRINTIVSDIDLSKVIWQGTVNSFMSAFIYNNNYLWVLSDEMKYSHMASLSQNFDVTSFWNEDLILFGENSCMISAETFEELINFSHNYPGKNECNHNSFKAIINSQYCEDCHKWIEPDHIDEDNDGYCDHWSTCGMYLGKLEENTVVKGILGDIYNEDRDDEYCTYWSLQTDGTLTFSGKTDMFLDESVLPLYQRYTDDVTTVIFEDGITSLYKYFYDVQGILYKFESVKKVVFPKTITEIPVFTCGECSSLEEIYIPASVTSIGYGAFDKCDSLKTIYFSGTEDQWKAIDFGEENEALLNVDIVFTDVSEDESSTDEPSTNEPSTNEPADEDKLVANEEFSITVNDESNLVELALGMMTNDIVNNVENEYISILDKDGNALTEDALVGTGCKVQVLDEEGHVLSEYAALVKNDVSGDGKITAADARLALRASAKLDEISDVYYIAADFNADGTITASDARLILRKSAGLE